MSDARGILESEIMSIPTVIAFHYTLKDKSGATIDSSEGADPLYVMLGKGHIVKGLDDVLPGMNVGDKDTIIVSAENGYGPVNDELRLKVRKDQFPPDANLKQGDQFQASPEPGSPVFTVMKIEGDEIFVDGNHPLAGVELHFDIEVMEKRPADPEELAHGHAHGPGGHGH